VVPCRKLNLQFHPPPLPSPPPFKCSLLSDKSCLPIIRRHVNSSPAPLARARSLARSRFSMETLGATMRLASDIDLHKRRRAILEPSYSALPRCPLPTLSSSQSSPPSPRRSRRYPSENCGEINTAPSIPLPVPFCPVSASSYYSKGFSLVFSFLFFPSLLLSFFPFPFLFFPPSFFLARRRCLSGWNNIAVARRCRFSAHPRPS